MHRNDMKTENTNECSKCGELRKDKLKLQRQELMMTENLKK